MLFRSLVTLTAKPDAGWKLDHFLVNDVAISANTFPMPAEDVLVSAEFVEKPAVSGDELTRETTGVTGTSYKDWTATGDSGTVYAGNSAGGNESIQLRTTSPAGIVITESTGKDVASVTVEWNDATADGRKVAIYGSAEAYAGPADLYGDAKGTLLGEIAKGDTTLEVPEGYPYVGILAKGGALYLSSVTIGFAGASAPSIAYTGETEKTLPDGEFELVFTLKNYDGDYAWSLIEGAGTLGEGGVYTWKATEAGEYTVKVAAINGELEIAQKEVKLTVSAPVVKYQIECAVGIPNGSVTADKTEAEEGELVTLTAKPDAGWKLDHFLVNDVAISANTFPMPAEDVLVSAEFVEITGETYTLVASADDFEEGADYLIVAYSKDKFTSALKNEANGTRIGVEEVVISEENTVTTDLDAIVWQIQAGAAEGQYVLFNAAKGVYAAGPKSEGNNAQLLTDGADALAQWTLDFTDVPAVAIGSVAYPERQLNRNSTATYAYFATYKGSGTKPYLFKKSGPAAPKITFTGDTTVQVGGSFELQFALKNYDGDYTWEVASREGGSINAEGVYTWTPADAGEVTITVVAKNGELDIASKDVVLTVTEPGPIPGEPALVFGGDKEGTVGTPVSFTVASVNVFSDPTVYLDGFEFPTASTLTQDDITEAYPTVTFTPDVAGDYVFDFSSGEVEASDYVEGSWTVTVSDGPGPQPGEAVITKMTIASNKMTIEFEGEGAQVLLSDDMQAWTPVDGAISPFTFDMKEAGKKYIGVK